MCLLLYLRVFFSIFRIFSPLWRIPFWAFLMYSSACFQATGNSAGMASRAFLRLSGILSFNQFSNILNTLRGVADVFLGWFGTSWNVVWTSIKDFFVGIWDSICSAFQSVADFFTNIWNAISTFFTTIATAIYTTAVTIFHFCLRLFCWNSDKYPRLLRHYFQCNMDGYFNCLHDHLWHNLKHLECYLQFYFSAVGGIQVSVWNDFSGDSHHYRQCDGLDLGKDTDYLECDRCFPYTVAWGH